MSRSDSITLVVDPRVTVAVPVPERDAAGIDISGCRVRFDLPDADKVCAHVFLMFSAQNGDIPVCVFAISWFSTFLCP